MLRKIHISATIKCKAKNALLVTAFLLSFFTLSGYVSTPRQQAQALCSGQLVIPAPQIAGRSINYYQKAVFFAAESRAIIAKQNDKAVNLFNRLSSVAHMQSAKRFLYIKPTIAYLISHIHFSTALS